MGKDREIEFVKTASSVEGHAVHGAPPRESEASLRDCWSAGATQAAPHPAPRLRSGPHEVSEPGQ